MEEGDDYPDDVIRAPQEVARRALALFGAVAVALGADRDTMREWLDREGLSGELTEFEARFLDDPDAPDRMSIDLSWQSERLVVLLWALGLGELPAADEQCDTAVFREVLPPYADVTVAAFLAGARLRPDAELTAMAGTMLDLHWHARDARLHDRAPKVAVDIEVIQERHHAINWVTGYCGQDWDEVTTDT